MICTSCATPITCRERCGLPTWMSLPTASSPGHRLRAVACETITTPARWAISVSVKSRSRTSGMPKAAKKPGETSLFSASCGGAPGLTAIAWPHADAEQRYVAGERHGTDSRDERHARAQLLAQVSNPLGVVADAIEPAEFDVEHVVGVESGLGGLSAQHAARKQRRAHQQHHAQRHLHCN